MLKYSVGATAHVIVAGNGTYGDGLNLFSLDTITYLYVDSNQNIFVSDSNNGRIIRWDNDSTVMKCRIEDSNGTFIASTLQSPGNSLTQLRSLYGITLDRWMNLYVADYGNNRVQLFCNGNTSGITIAGGVIGEIVYLAHMILNLILE